MVAKNPAPSQSEIGWKALAKAGAHFVLAKRCTLAHDHKEADCRHKRAIGRGWEMPANAPTLAKARAWLDSGGYVGFKPGSLDLVCVDFDSPKTMKKSVVPEALGQPLARIASERRGRGHFYYRKPEGEVGNSKWEGGDIRCSKGYAIIYSASALAAALPLVADAERVDLDRLPKKAKVTLPLVKSAAESSSATLTQGERNDSLTSFAGKYRQQGASGREIESLLLRDNAEHCSPLLSEDEVKGIAKSVSRYDRGYTQDDTGNGLLIADLYGDDLRYDHKRRRWLIWAGHWWREDMTEDVYQFAKLAEMHRLVLASKMGDKESDRELAWAHQSRIRSRLKAALEAARDEVPVTNEGEGWDANHFLLAVENGVIDLKTGKLRDGQRDDQITIRAPIAFDAKASAPTFHKYLSEVQPDEAMRSYLQRVAGYCLTGSIEERCFFFFYGLGHNGKTILAETIARMLGQLGQPAAPKLLIKKRDIDKAAIADIEGKRVIVTIEPNAGERLDEGFVKQLTGGDTLKGRRLYENYHEFRPAAKVILLSNNKPRVEDLTDAIWERIKLIPFEVHIDEPDRDKRLADKLQVEWPGILNWMLAGCLSWQRDGLGEPEKVTKATAVYRASSDPLSAFVGACCIVGNEHRVMAGPLYAAYDAWARRRPPTQRLDKNEFGERMAERFLRKRNSKGKLYLRISLRPE